MIAEANYALYASASLKKDDVCPIKKRAASVAVALPTILRNSARKVVRLRNQSFM